MDLAIIMDRSQTIGSKDFEKSRSFVRNLTHRYKVSPRRTRVGIIAYDESAELFVSFRHRKQQNVAAMTSIINRIYYTGGFFTRTDLALEKANFKLFNRDRGDKPNVLVVITDGGSTHGPGNDIAKPIPDVVKPLVIKGVKMIAVGVGLDDKDLNDDIELLQIANGQKENVFTIDQFDKLAKVLKRVLRSSCKKG